MKIAGVHAIPLAIPLAPGAPPTSWAAEIGRQLLVRVTTDEGLTGWGECFAYGVPLAVGAVVEEALAPLVTGEDPTQIECLTDRMHRALMIWGRRGLAMMAVSGVELALWDLAGKALGVPVYQLLGGLCASRARAYASLLRYETPAQVRQAVAAALGLGFTAIKLHQTDLQSVAAAREAAGAGAELMLDTNCPWTVEEAIRIGRRLERYDLRWLEEPVWPPEDYEGLARVRAALGIPIACGENEATAFAFRAILAAGAADILQPTSARAWPRRSTSSPRRPVCPTSSSHRASSPRRSSPSRSAARVARSACPTARGSAPTPIPTRSRATRTAAGPRGRFT